MLQERNEQIWDIERIFYSERCGREWAGESSRSIEAKWGNGKGINLLLTSENLLNETSRHASHFAFLFAFKETRAPQMVHGKAWF